MKRNKAEKFEAARVMSDSIPQIALSSSPTTAKTQGKDNKDNQVEKPILMQLFPKLETLDAITLSIPGFNYQQSSSEADLKKFTEGLSDLFKKNGVNTKEQADELINKIQGPFKFSDSQIQAIKNSLDEIREREKSKKEEFKTSNLSVSSNPENKSLASA